MDWKSRIRTALSRRGQTPDDEVLEELAQHARAMYDAARAEHASPEEAARRVEIQVTLWASDASLLTHRRHASAVVTPPPPSSTRTAGVLQDVRYGLRVLRKRPVATLVAMLTMALGIGATTVLFSVAWGVLFKPLPWPDADRLVRVTETREGATRTLPNILTNGTYLAWREAPSTIDEIGGWQGVTVTMTTGGEPQRVRAGVLTTSVFSLLRAQPALGRPFADDASDDASIILSHGLWMQQFGGAEDILGRVVQLDGEPHTVIGVMPAGFAFPDRDTRAWVRLTVPPVIGESPDARTLSMFSAMARLKPGATPAQAASEATARARTAPDPGMVAIAVFGSRGAVTVDAVPALDFATRDVRDALLVFLAAVGLLLATATANVASVQLARATTRRREMAIRAALGAQGGRLARQLLVENVLLGAGGALLGIVFAFAMHRALPSVLPPDFPRADVIAIDGRVLAFSLAVSLAASLLFGLLPALQARRVNMVESLTEDSLAPVGGSARSRTARARALIMAGQVAVASVLLIGASLLIRSFVALLNADRGYEVTNVLVARLPMPNSLFTSERRAQIVDGLLGRLAVTPGVVHAGVTSVLPLASGEAFFGFTLPPGPGATAPVAAQAGIRTMSPDYPRSIGMRLLDGRHLAPTDTITSQPVMLVNRTFVDRYLGGGRALGRRLAVVLDDGKPEWEIVGVLDDVRMQGAADPPQPEMFVSYGQVRAGVRMRDVTLVVRTTGDPVGLVPSLRAMVHAQDASIPLDAVGTMEQRLLGNLARPRLYAILLGGFAAFALVIAGVGLFGVLSYSVAQRSREIAVRSALGARPIDNLALVLRQGLAVTALGLAAGLLLSMFATRAMSSFLYGVAPHDAVTYVAVPIILLSVACVACFIPAWRASRLDPLTVLRAG